MSYKRTISAIAVAGIAVVGMLGAAAPASASGGYPECGWGALYMTSAHATVRVPTTDGYSGLQNCTLNKGPYRPVAAVYTVSPLQSALRECYGKNITVDGEFGPATLAALVQVQWTIGVTADGVWGPNTRDHMLWPLRSTKGTITCVSMNWIRNNGSWIRDTQ